MTWPPEYSAEFERRLKLARGFADNNNALWKNGAEQYYTHNPVQWINDFCVTYDPRNKPPKPKLMPFVLFPRQEELVQCIIECIRDGESLLVEKSRDMGASWLCCALSVHQWLFVDGTSFGWGSRKQDLVDKIGDPDSIFEKMRIIIDNLPAFMLPPQFNVAQHATFMKLVNPNNSSTVTGEAGDNIGRGGRKTVYFKDESAHYERPDKIEAALGDTTDVQIDISSVNGTANVFYRRRQAGELWYPGKEMPKGKTRIFVMDWRDHPLKDQEWYDRRRARAENEGLLVQFAQEVDRDYSSAVEGIIIKPAWVKAARDAHIRLAHLGNWHGIKETALDVADEGIDKNALAARDGSILTFVDDWAQGDTSVTAQKAVIKSKELCAHNMYYDCIGVGAGVKGETNSMKKKNLVPDSLSILPWNAALSGKALLDAEKNIIPGDKQSPKNCDYFASLSAQAMWRLAQRFYKTYMAVTVGRKYSPDELISISSDIPKIEELIVELSQHTQTVTGTGKMGIDKKPAGTKSPNMADSVKMVFNPYRKGVDYSRLVKM